MKICENLSDYYTRGEVGGGVLGILGRGVPPGSPNPEPISSDQKMPFSAPVFRPGLYNPYPFSDLASESCICNCSVFKLRISAEVKNW